MKPLLECKVELHKLELYKCDQCTILYYNQEDLTRHVNEHYEMYQTHIRSSYVKLKKINILTCDICSRGFLYNKDLLLHKLEHIRQSVKKSNSEKNKLYDNKDLVKSHECPICDYRFVAKSTLEAHLFIHEPFPHICDCGIGFYELKDLIGHQKLVHYKPKVEDVKPVNNNVVETPKEVIKVKFSVKKIKRKKCKSENIPLPQNCVKNDNWTRLPMPPLDVDFTQTKDKKFECPICKKTSNCKKNAEIHYRSIHRNERPYLCNLCPKTFNQWAGVRAHVLIHTGVKNYHCQYCDKQFYNSDAKLRHEWTHTGYKPYKCSFCEKSFCDRSAFSRHERIHTGDKRHRCEFCPKAFTDYSALYVHRKRHVEGSKTFTCDKCDIGFYTKSRLNLHIRIVHDRVLKFQCDHCNKRCSMKNNLINHIQAMHSTSRKTLRCDICNKHLKTKDGLKRHVEVIHAQKKYKRALARVHNNNYGDIRFKCNECGYGFGSKKPLITHIAKYHGEPKYICDHCGEKFTLKKYISAHIKTYHLEILRCHICYKGFCSNFDFTNHKNSGCSVVKHHCKVCYKTFKSVDGLKHHKLKHKGNCKNKHS